MEFLSRSSFQLSNSDSLTTFPLVIRFTLTGLSAKTMAALWKPDFAMPTHFGRLIQLIPVLGQQCVDVTQQAIVLKLRLP